MDPLSGVVSTTAFEKQIFSTGASKSYFKNFGIGLKVEGLKLFRQSTSHAQLHVRYLLVILFQTCSICIPAAVL